MNSRDHLVDRLHIPSACCVRSILAPFVAPHDISSTMTTDITSPRIKNWPRRDTPHPKVGSRSAALNWRALWTAADMTALADAALNKAARFRIVT